VGGGGLEEARVFMLFEFGCPEDGATVSSTKSITVARDSCDLKKYSCKEVGPVPAELETEDLEDREGEGRCQASVSPQSSESYSESEGQSSESENSTATLRARMVATSAGACPSSPWS